MVCMYILYSCLPHLFSLPLQNHILRALDLAIREANLFIREDLEFLKTFEFWL